MLLVRFTILVLATVAAAVVAFAVDAVWALALAILVLLALLFEVVILIFHYTSASGVESPDDETMLEDRGLVERDTGLPTRRRWNEPQAREYADEVARRGVVAVPDGWRGPDGAHRVLLVTTGTVAPERLRQGLADRSESADVAVLVVVPTLARDAREFRLGDASEPVAHAETVARETVAALTASGIHASGHIGPADPAVAVSDGLRTFAAEKVVVARRHAEPMRYLENVDTVEEAASAFGVPLEEWDLSGPATGDPTPR
jgi:hypothetical protein